MAFDYTTGSPDNLTGGGPARMQDIQGPFYDIRAYLNTAIGSGGGGGGGSTPVLATAAILDVGVQGQIRAGRQLTVADFTNLGLVQPIGLWNLSDLTNLGSDTQVLVQRKPADTPAGSSVPFGAGINGVAATSAVFAANSGQALYIAGAGATNYNIRTGSWGCWFRTAKRATLQYVLSKYPAAAGQRSWSMNVPTTNVVQADVWSDGTSGVSAVGVSDVCDDRWHFVVATHDAATARIYVDGALEGTVSAAFPLFAGSAPLNIGAYGADSGTTAGAAHYGRVDEAFVTADVLTEDQIRCLYAAKLTHALGVTPTAVRLNVHRLRKGASLVAGDFTTTPIRLYNFTAGDLAGTGSDTSGNRLLTNNGTALSVAGADGTPTSAFSFAGAQSLSATDTGLPNLLTTRSYGCWFKTSVIATGNMMGWGTISTGDTRIRTEVGAGGLQALSAGTVTGGPFVCDGLWHHVVVVEDNNDLAQVRRKLYLDGRVVGGSFGMNSLTLAGANRFRIGAAPDGTEPFTGQIDGVFVTGYALTAADIATLYAKGLQDLGASPKNPGDHVERMSSTDVLFIGDTLESQHTVDLSVVA